MAQRLLFIVALVMSCGIYTASAQIFVKIRPVRVVTVRTEAPSPRHIWVDEDWRERDGRYEWSGGHWEAPPHENDRYTEGHWRHSGGGHQWVQGRWGHDEGHNGRGHDHDRK